MTIIKLEKTESTNDYLKNLIKSGQSGQIAVVAKCQSAGRGCGEHTFYSPAGGLYLSFSMVPVTSPEDTAEITHCAGVAVRRALSSLVPEVDFRIKPVNDLYLSGKKICGILTELSRGVLVIGIGINVNTPAFPEELNATSLLLETGIETDLDTVTDALLAELKTLDSLWPACRDAYEEEYRRHLLPGYGQTASAIEETNHG